MFRASEITRMHLEVTSKCNASCPQCARNIFGAIRDPSFDVADISVEEFSAAFPPAFVRQLKHVFMCGTYGEPIVARDCLEIWKYIRRNSGSRVSTVIHTNGGARTPDWWSELANYCELAWFGIDGLEDTNHLYRQNVNWNKLMTNCRAYIKGGGRAVWVMNVFKHNEHQVDRAREMAKSLGFSDFLLRKTARFYLPHVGLVSKVPVFNSKSEITHFLEMPENPDMLNVQFSPEEKNQAEVNDKLAYQAGSDFIENVRRYKLEKREKWQSGAAKEIEPVPEDVARRFNNTEISCRAQKNKEIYVSATGLVWPCCFLSVHEWGQGFRQPQVDRIFEEIEGKMDSLSFRKKTITEIVEGEFFQKYVPDSWKKTKIGEGRIYECAYWCPKENGFFDGQTKPKPLKQETNSPDVHA